MKLRVTIMTENDVHPKDEHTNEKLEAVASVGWQLLLDTLLKDVVENDRVIVEKCEVVER